MTNKLGLVLFSLLLPLITGCSEPVGAAGKEWNVEKKYYLKDCIVKVDFLWESGSEYAERARIFSEVDEQIKRAMVSGRFPMFTGGYTRELTYDVFYYADQCEQKGAITQKIIDEFLIPNVSGFPPYKILDKNIEPGFDGVTPGGWWLDQ